MAADIPFKLRLGVEARGTVARIRPPIPGVALERLVLGKGYSVRQKRALLPSFFNWILG